MNPRRRRQTRRLNPYSYPPALNNRRRQLDRRVRVLTRAYRRASLSFLLGQLVTAQAARALRRLGVAL